MDQGFSDLNLVRELTNIKTLELLNTSVTDLSPVKDLINLEELVIRVSPVSDIEPIKVLKNLKLLLLEDCINITDEQIEELKRALPDLKISR